MYPHKYNITCKHGLPIYYLKTQTKHSFFFLVCLLFFFGLVRLQNVQQMMQHDNCKMYVCIYNVCMYVCMYMYVYVCIYIVLCMHIMLASTSILVAESCSNSFTMLILIIFAVCNQSVFQGIVLQTCYKQGSYSLYTHHCFHTIIRQSVTMHILAVMHFLICSGIQAGHILSSNKLPPF